MPDAPGPVVFLLQAERKQSGKSAGEAGVGGAHWVSPPSSIKAHSCSLSPWSWLAGKHVSAEPGVQWGRWVRAAGPLVGQGLCALRPSPSAHLYPKDPRAPRAIPTRDTLGDTLLCSPLSTRVWGRLCGRPPTLSRTPQRAHRAWRSQTPVPVPCALQGSFAGWPGVRPQKKRGDSKPSAG